MAALQQAVSSAALSSSLAGKPVSAQPAERAHLGGWRAASARRSRSITCATGAGRPAGKSGGQASRAVAVEAETAVEEGVNIADDVTQVRGAACELRAASCELQLQNLVSILCTVHQRRMAVLCTCPVRA